MLQSVVVGVEISFVLVDLLYNDRMMMDASAESHTGFG